MAQSGSNKKVANSLVAVSSAAVLAVYSAGYVRTRTAADRFALQAAERRPAGQTPPRVTSPVEDSRPVAPMPVRSPSPLPSLERKRTAAAPILTASSKPAPSTAEVPVIAATTAPAETAPLSIAPVVAPPVAPPAVV